MEVYVKTNQKGQITAINSGLFIKEMTDDWQLIDEGEGDRYTHAQGNYLSDGLMARQGIYQYELADGKAKKRDAKELEAEVSAIPAPENEMNEFKAALSVLRQKLEAQDEENGVIYEALRTGGLTPLPAPGETWDRAKWYRSLDIVTYEGGSYTCQKTCKGKSPSLENYWEATPEEAEPIPWEDILSGDMIAVDTQVTHNDEIWRCIKEHIKSVVRQPSAMQTDYWEAVT